MNFKNVAEIKAEMEQLDFAMEAHLRASGWKTTCKTPGSYWMWEKEVGGQHFLVDRETAIRIQGIQEADAQWASGPAEAIEA